MKRPESHAGRRTVHPLQIPLLHLPRGSFGKSHHKDRFRGDSTLDQAAGPPGDHGCFAGTRARQNHHRPRHMFYRLPL